MRVLIVEDQVLLRDGLTRMLSAYGMDVTTTHPDGTRLAERLTAQRPDVAVVDVRLPPTFTDEGLRAAVAARRAVPNLPVLVLSQYVERLYARELLADRAGAVGYLLKDRVANVRQFIDAVRRVAAGGTVMDPDVIARLLHRPDTVAALTARERDVLRLMAEGHSNAAIAARIAVTQKSVSNLSNSLFAKLGLPPSAELHRRVLAVLSYLDHA
jgi:DNA-binding NarL/FixJ family response regulator